MWMIVMFDLPVTEKAERRAATGFRNHLLDLGFNMAQFSVYYRLLGGRDAVRAMEGKIQAKVPIRGSVHVLTITDKQYENIRTYQGKHKVSLKKPQQLMLF